MPETVCRCSKPLLHSNTNVCTACKGRRLLALPIRASSVPPGATRHHRSQSSASGPSSSRSPAVSPTASISSASSSSVASRSSMDAVRSPRGSSMGGASGDSLSKFATSSPDTYSPMAAGFARLSLSDKKKNNSSESLVSLSSLSLSERPSRPSGLRMSVDARMMFDGLP